MSPDYIPTWAYRRRLPHQTERHMVYEVQVPGPHYPVTLYANAILTIDEAEMLAGDLREAIELARERRA